MTLAIQRCHFVLWFGVAAYGMEPAPLPVGSLFEEDTATGVSVVSSSDLVDTPEVEIPASTFEMGCTGPDNARCARDLHTVHVDAFAIDRDEVLLHDYRLCVDMGWCTEPFLMVEPMRPVDDGPDMPVGGIDFTPATDYCRWLGKRLPTSEEWELAARGVDGEHRYPWGNDWDPSKCNGCDTRSDPEHALGDYTPCDGSSDSYAGMAPVDAFPEGDSPWGVSQMCGNAFEWTATEWEEESTGGQHQGFGVVGSGPTTAWATPTMACWPGSSTMTRSKRPETTSTFGVPAASRARRRHDDPQPSGRGTVFIQGLCSPSAPGTFAA